MAVKFGLGQMNNPTPAGLNLWVKVATITMGVILLWLPTATFIGANTREITGSILGLLIAVSNGIAPLFGIQVAPNEKIPVADVTAMEDTKGKP